jgi:FtsZ-interacting cell division protein YlmF
MKNPFNKRARGEYGSYNDSYDNDFYRGDDQDDDGVIDDYAEDETPALPPKKPAAKENAANQVKVVKPRDYQDCPIIANYLIDGYTVVMNIEALERAATLRLIDFLLGVLHVLGGELRRVTKTTLVLSPRSGEVVGDDELSDDEYDE